MTMTILEQEKLYDRAMRLLYGYGKQEPFTDEELKKVFELLETLHNTNLTLSREDWDDDDF